jgi:hypothetical protein
MSSVMVRLSLCAAVALAIGGCESEFIADRGRPVPARAVENPTNTNDGNGESLAGTGQGVPLVSVDLPNKNGEPVKVRTIGDNIRDTLNPPTTAPANANTPGETTTRPTQIRIDPITGAPQ